MLNIGTIKVRLQDGTEDVFCSKEGRFPHIMYSGSWAVITEATGNQRVYPAQRVVFIEVKA